jgi:uncharacterized protein (DUF1778 family)
MKKISIAMLPAGQRLMLRTTAAQHRLLRRAAKLTGATLSQFFSEAAIYVATRLTVKGHMAWKSVLETDPQTGELLLELPKPFLEEQDWRVGDTVQFEDVKGGSFKLVNISRQEREHQG